MTDPVPYESGEFCWVDLVAHNMADAKQFYADVFGWEVADQDTKGGPRYAMFEIGGRAVAGLGEMDAAMRDQGIPSMWNCYVQVDDVDAVAAKVAELGGQVQVPPMDVMDVGRLAFFSDPSGAMIATWQPGARNHTSIRNVANTMCWHELATRDLDGAKAFYGELFGWNYRKHDGSPSEYYVVDGGDGKDRGGLMAMTEEWGDVPAHWKVYFIVEDVAKTVAAVRAAGGQVHVEPFETQVGPIAIVADSQGAGFNLMQLGASCS